MKRVAFPEGVVLAAGFSIAGSLGYTVLSQILSADISLRLLISAVSFGYLLYLLSRSSERVGRSTVLAAWILASVTAWFALSSSFAYLAVQVTLIWSVRSLYFYQSLFSALADAVLNGAALLGALWAIHQTGSLLLSLWCFFLVQASFAFIPARPGRNAAQAQSNIQPADAFEQAHSNAERAFRKLSSDF